jgi:hypothetical protein
MLVVELIAEGLGKKNRVVMAELGVETDEEAGAALPPLVPETKSAKGRTK